MDNYLAKIVKEEQRLQELEKNTGKELKNLERNYQGQIDEFNRKHENVVTHREGQMESLDSDLGVLNQFKDTKQ